ncbi:LacI family transcriptional regulator [Blautia sp. An249]|uniref:ABC transporter substrate-binding protein n=1 Tax=Blautia sp. An249 TaxID=1965603 RepID=UPI000B56A814|nr:ABC transporter substrate-binding protein [Blautia sp. An249]OUO79694.1 LacI family transcriptional regulator [Blautia sp. An249]
MKKKVLATLLSVAVVGTMLAGCGGSSDTASDDSAATEDTAAADDDAAAEDDAAADDASGSGDVLTVGFSQVGAESDWRTANTESMKGTFTEENGYELIFDDAQQKQENQITAIRNFIQQGVDYILLAPVTETGWDTVLQEAYDAGIPVITVDRMVDISDENLVTAWVGSNFKLEGQKACAWLKAFLEAKGRGEEEINIVDIQGTIGASAQIGRTEALEEAIEANENWNMLAQQSGEFTQAKGQEVMESILKQSGDDVDVVYCENDNEAFGAIDAIKAAGYEIGTEDGQIMVMSFDAATAALNMTMSGEIALATECNPLHGPRVDEIIKALEAGEEVEKETFVDETMFATDDTVATVDVDGESYEVTAVTQEVIDGRAY